MPTTLTRAKTDALNLWVQTLKQSSTIRRPANHSRYRKSEAFLAAFFHSLSSGDAGPFTINIIDEASEPKGRDTVFVRREARFQERSVLASSAGETAPFRGFSQNWGA